MTCVCDPCVCVSPDHLWVLLPDVFMVISSEVAVDIVKHAFITKFNEITADVSSLPLPYLIRRQTRTAQDSVSLSLSLALSHPHPSKLLSHWLRTVIDL